MKPCERLAAQQRGVERSWAGVRCAWHEQGFSHAQSSYPQPVLGWRGHCHRAADHRIFHGTRCLTIALQIQEATLRNFFDQTGGLARGTGFLARFLVA